MTILHVPHSPPTSAAQNPPVEVAFTALRANLHTSHSRDCCWDIIACYLLFEEKRGLSCLYSPILFYETLHELRCKFKSFLIDCSHSSCKRLLNVFPSTCNHPVHPMGWNRMYGRKSSPTLGDFAVKMSILGFKSANYGHFLVDCCFGTGWNCFKGPRAKIKPKTRHLHSLNSTLRYWWKWTVSFLTFCFYYSLWPQSKYLFPSQMPLRNCEENTDLYLYMHIYI